MGVGGGKRIGTWFVGDGWGCSPVNIQIASMIVGLLTFLAWAIVRIFGDGNQYND